MKLDIRDKMGVLVTLSCDCECKHCYIDSQPPGSTPELAFEEWKKILDNYKNRGGRELSLHGGEPLLYEDLDKLLLYAHKIGLHTSLITNTLHASDKIIKILHDTSTYVLVSLDGPKNNYLNFRGSDKFDLVINNIDKLLSVGVPVHPIYVIHKQNYNDFSWIIEFCLDRKISAVTLSPIQPIGRCKELKEFLLSPNELEIFIDRYHQLNSLYNGMLRIATQALYLPKDEERYLNDEKKLKNYNDSYYFIMNDGSLVMDFDLPNPRNFIIGNAFDLEYADDEIFFRYKDMLDKAFLSGLKELRNGNAINWYEIIQHETSE